MELTPSLHIVEILSHSLPLKQSHVCVVSVLVPIKESTAPDNSSHLPTADEQVRESRLLVHFKLFRTGNSRVFLTMNKFYIIEFIFAVSVLLFVDNSRATLKKNRGELFFISDL